MSGQEQASGTRVLAGLAVTVLALAAVAAGELALAGSRGTAVAGRDEMEAALAASREELDSKEIELLVAEGDLSQIGVLTEWARFEIFAAQVETIETRQEREEAETDHALAILELAESQAELASTETAVQLRGSDVSILLECLRGVRSARAHLEVDDHEAAVRELQAVEAACREADSLLAGGISAAFPFDFADPFVLFDGSTYWGYATNGGGGDVQLIRSSDLVTWEWVGSALSSLPSWASPHLTWAPSVLRRGSTYLLYYTANHAATGHQCISVAVAGSPAGPFVDTSSGPLVCQHDLRGSIDPSPYLAADGTPYLTWKAEGELGGGVASIWVQQLGGDGRSLVGEASQVLRADQAWEDGIVEGPAMVSVNGALYLFYSGNHWDTAGYGVGYAICSGPLGPCSKRAGPVLASSAARAGPGGAEFFVDGSARLRVAYHAWVLPDVGYPHRRTLRIGFLGFDGDVPVLD